MMIEINYLLSSRVTNRLRELCESRQHLTKLAESVQFLFLLGLYVFFLFLFVCVCLSLIQIVRQHRFTSANWYIITMPPASLLR